MAAALEAAALEAAALKEEAEAEAEVEVEVEEEDYLAHLQLAAWEGWLLASREEHRVLVVLSLLVLLLQASTC